MTDKKKTDEEVVWDKLKTPYTPTYEDGILSVIRRVMPQMIANQIVGVQPMTGYVGAVFKIRYPVKDKKIELWKRKTLNGLRRGQAKIEKRNKREMWSKLQIVKKELKPRLIYGQ